MESIGEVNKHGSYPLLLFSRFTLSFVDLNLSLLLTTELSEHVYVGNAIYQVKRKKKYTEKKDLSR